MNPKLWNIFIYLAKKHDFEYTIIEACFVWFLAMQTILVSNNQPLKDYLTTKKTRT